MLRWIEEGEYPFEEELSPESPTTKALVEQWKTLRVQDGVFQKGWEDAATHERTWLLIVPLPLRAELLEEADTGVSVGHLGRKKTLYFLRQRLHRISKRQDVEEWCKL